MNIRSITLSLLMLNAFTVPMAFADTCCNPCTTCNNSPTHNLMVFIDGGALYYSSIELSDLKKIITREQDKFSQALEVMNSQYKNLVSSKSLTEQDLAQIRYLAMQMQKLNDDHQNTVWPIGKKMGTVQEKFMKIAKRIAKQLGAIGIFSSESCIEPSHDITQMTLGELNKEYLAGK